MRLAIGIEYDGSAYYGWQRQRQSPTVQECVETALARVADHAVVVHCAGRTDTGVHALCQVAHFDAHSHRSERGWVLGGNSNLPSGISILWAREVPDDFHARISATGRSYVYRILNRPVRPGLERQRVGWVREPLDVRRMQEAAPALVGRHDFSSFRAAGCQAKSPVREIRHIEISRHGHDVRLEISADAFLYRMVRNITGSLIEIGLGKRDPGWLARVLEARERPLAGVSAPAGGLYFVAPEYPDRFRLPLPEAVYAAGGLVRA